MSPCLALASVPYSLTACMPCVFYMIRTIDNHYSLHSMQRLVFIMECHPCSLCGTSSLFSLIYVNFLPRRIGFNPGLIIFPLISIIPTMLRTVHTNAVLIRRTSGRSLQTEQCSFGYQGPLERKVLPLVFRLFGVLMSICSGVIFLASSLDRTVRCECRPEMTGNMVPRRKESG
jgi:hypothetical protein